LEYKSWGVTELKVQSKRGARCHIGCGNSVVVAAYCHWNLDIQNICSGSIAAANLY
jgi:hypothetical protein